MSCWFHSLRPRNELLCDITLWLEFDSSASEGLGELTLAGHLSSGERRG